MNNKVHDGISIERLQEELLFVIHQFERWAAMPPLARNNQIVKILEELLVEAKKRQLFESKLDFSHE